MGTTQEPNDPPATLADKLRAARERAFVGRTDELRLFRDALERATPPFSVLHLHGPGGVGKTALLRRYAREAEATGSTPVLLDGHAIAATREGFLDALAGALGADDPVAALAAARRPILLLDTYEELAALDGWLRDELLPQLPDDALVVIAGRRAPLPGWRADPGWQELLRVRALRNLTPDESVTLLAARNVPGNLHAEVLDFTRGHPLALTLVAEVVAQRAAPEPLVPEANLDVIRALVDRFVRDVPGEAHRAALEVCALARITTEALLRRALADMPSRELFDWLCDLSFVEVTDEGARPHDLARDALDAELRWRDPDHYLELHHRIQKWNDRRARQATGRERERATLDAVHLHFRHPVLRRLFDWSAMSETWSEPAQPADHDRLLALVRRHEGAESAAIAAAWLDQRPEAFYVFRHVDEPELLGFTAHLVLDRDDGPQDPCVAAAWRYVRRHGPLRAGERIAIARFWVERDRYQSRAFHHLVATRATVTYQTPRLAWSFAAAVAEPDAWAEMFTELDFARAQEADYEVGGRRYGAFAHDWRAMPLRRWRRKLGERHRTTARADSRDAPSDVFTVLDEPAFADAVRHALRAYTRPEALRGNPLLESRVVAEALDGQARLDRLRALLDEAAAGLRAHPRDEKLYRALEVTYFHPAPNQELAADRLDLPSSTYRRHLTKGVQRVTDWLWARELYGE